MKLCIKNPFVLVYAEKQAEDAKIETLEGIASYKKDVEWQPFLGLFFGRHLCLVFDGG